jgi:hypothetical protein
MRAMMSALDASTPLATASSRLTGCSLSVDSSARTRSYWSSSRSSSRSSRAVSLLSSVPRLAARPSSEAAIPAALASSRSFSRWRMSCSAAAVVRSSTMWSCTVRASSSRIRSAAACCPV